MSTRINIFTKNWRGLKRAGAKIKTNALEPLKTGSNKERSRAFGSVKPTWLRIVDAVRTIIQQQNEYIYISDTTYYIFQKEKPAKDSKDMAGKSGLLAPTLD